jgi:hypothetical protein
MIENYVGARIVNLASANYPSLLPPAGWWQWQQWKDRLWKDRLRWQQSDGTVVAVALAILAIRHLTASAPLVEDRQSWRCESFLLLAVARTKSSCDHAI